MTDGFHGRPGSVPPKQQIQLARRSDEMAAIDLYGATVIVTGASRGFGRATAVALAKSGDRVRDPRWTRSVTRLTRPYGSICTRIDRND